MSRYIKGLHWIAIYCRWSLFQLQPAAEESVLPAASTTLQSWLWIWWSVDHTSIVLIGPFASKPCPSCRKGVFTMILLHQKALSYISYQAIIFSHAPTFSTRGYRLSLKDTCHEPRAYKKPSITWLSKAKAHLQQEPSPATSVKAILILPDWCSKARSPHQVPTTEMQKEEKTLG